MRYYFDKQIGAHCTFLREECYNDYAPPRHVKAWATKTTAFIPPLDAPSPAVKNGGLSLLSLLIGVILGKRL